MSIYREENIITTSTGTKCERMYNHPKGKTWRVILGEEDYDYIEDGNELAMLEKELVELEMDKFHNNPEYEVPSEVEDSIADEAGLLRNWDHVTETYTETQLKWLERLHDYYNQIL
jgi:hypothetical protein